MMQTQELVMTDVEVMTTALSWLDDGDAVTLVTVIETWGSAPRKAGAQLVVRQDGLFQGSVSGGCIEGAVIQNAIEQADIGGRMLTFGVSTEAAWAVGLSCGGEIRVWLEPLTKKVAQTIVTAMRARETVVLQIPLQETQPMHAGVWNPARSLDSAEPSNSLPAYAPKSILQTDGRAVRIYHPAKRLFIIGAVHIAQALIPMAQRVGYAVTLIDPRSIFLDAARWGDVPRVDDFPEDYFPAVGLGHRDAVVALSHNPTFDDPALHLALQSGVFYVGALGSRKNHAKRCARLQAAGCTTEQVSRISGPVGLDIGAQTPAEIAVSILAEMIQAAR